MTSAERENLEAARRFVESVAAGATGDELASFFTPGVVAVEHPNPIVPAAPRAGWRS